METLQMLDFIMNNPKFIWAVASVVGFLILLGSVIRFHFSKTYEKFNLIKIFAIDTTTGEASDSKVRLNTAFVIMTWAFIYITLQDKLTEWYVVVYAGAWVTDRFLARMNKQKDQNDSN
jgi:hypothetical protein